MGSPCPVDAVGTPGSCFFVHNAVTFDPLPSILKILFVPSWIMSPGLLTCEREMTEGVVLVLCATINEGGVGAVQGGRLNSVLNSQLGK